MTKKHGRKTEQVVRSTRSIGNISDCETLDDVRRRFIVDAKRWEDETGDSKEALDLAVAYWLGYPAFYANADFLYDGDMAERCCAKVALDRAHRLATEYLMAEAERCGIDSAPLMESAMLCRAILADKDNARLCCGPGMWPDCLIRHLKNLADGQWEIAQRGYATLARLSAKIEAAKDGQSFTLRQYRTNRHSPDFSEVVWSKKRYRFTRTQAQAIAILWNAWETGAPTVRGKTIASELDLGSTRTLAHVFRGCKAWKELIISVGKGAYCLNDPDDPLLQTAAEEKSNRQSLKKGTHIGTRIGKRTGTRKK